MFSGRAVYILGSLQLAILALLVYQIMQHRHVLLFYEMLFEERSRQLDAHSEELQELEARVTRQTHTLQGLEQRIREVEGRLGQGDTPEAHP